MGQSGDIKFSFSILPKNFKVKCGFKRNEK